MLALVQRLVSVVKIVTVLEECVKEEQCSVVGFLWAKRLYAQDQMFPAYGGKCLSCKVVYNWVEKFPQRRSKVVDDARPGAEVAETTFRRLYAVGFSALMK
jgi:hypothetical protein